MKKNIIFTVLVFAIVLGFLTKGFDALSTAQDSQDYRRVEENLATSIVACYSIEGAYPEDLDYLKKNYSFYYNEDLYQIHYRYLGVNLMPEYKVFLKGK